MKYFKLTILFCALIALLPAVPKAQNAPKVNIKAIVYGADNKPLKGALVTSTEKGHIEVVTDETGTFTLEAPLDASLKIEAPGYTTKYLAASADLTQVVMEEDKDGGMIPVAFRKINRKDAFGDVAVVNVEELLKKNYFTYSLDGMDALAPGFNGNSTWAMGSYLLLIDGVPREAGNVMPTEIEHITFLKGVNAVALYGSRAAKGAVLITTKRGKANDRRVDFRVNSGVHTPKRYPKYLGSAEWMTLYNEAFINDGRLVPGTDIPHDEEEIYNHASGRNPYRYPNVDYYSDEFLKKAYSRHDATMEISGGNDKARYYTNIGFNTSGSLLNFGEAIKNDRSDRLNLRGNIDVNLNEYLSFNVDATAIFYTGRGVNADYWGSAATLRPHRFAPLVPIEFIEETDEASLLFVRNSNYVIDGKYLLGGTQLDQTNPFAAIYAGGNNKYTSRQFQFNTGVNADLRNVLKGLSFNSQIAIDYNTSYNLSFNNSYAVYRADWNTYSGTDLISSLQKFNEDQKSGVQNVSNSWYRQTIAANAYFNYKNTFSGKHNVSAIAAVNGFQISESAIYHRISNANLGFQAGYNYAQKYYFDFSGALIHSARLPEGQRKAFSPTVSLGWRLSEEQFLSGSGFVNDLRLTASAGILHTDLDIADYYLYEGIYTVNGSWYGWKDGTGIQATESRRGANPILSFPKREELSVGLEGSFLNNTLKLGGNFFVNTMSGNVIQAAVLYPSYFTTGWPVSSFTPYVNYNNDKRTGFDFNASFSKRTGEVDWSVGVNGMYYATKATRRAEIPAEENLRRAGRPLDGIWGLQNEGFFMDDADIAASPNHLGQVMPGDIKYKDQNGDGLIDSRDEVYLGRGGWFGAPLTTGVHISAKWKNLSLFALGVGRFGAYAMKNSSYFWVNGEDKYSEVVRNRWTEGTKHTATFPRLTTGAGDNNFRSSDFWLYNTNRFDLGKVQISYDMTGLLKSKAFVRELGVYVSGFNLLTISPEREVLEMNVGSAPQTRLYNLGLKALF
ncbi:SusC/RagA family TonB-linked outer membrane protein [Parasegetibacter sp. NRK P23]|uniref:SusC/RagA family TonB-linked outer membrane protein n=1 Tax=Parasegetibacter sp. NRK P23 TaxID=2942999 RepID=UPI002044534F|nr:SusC/RagA family TonB-linked outer membrane protein [Parasegetibacter sp. NRK P23]MCM5529336.1 SusC/RagA family TonB-linked outer membrane protein [Parasegetibacter sp. NRK P23]